MAEQHLADLSFVVTNQENVAELSLANSTPTTDELRSLSLSARARAADAWTLDPRTFAAFASSSREDEHGNIAFEHSRQGDAEIHCLAGYSFRAAGTCTSEEGRSIWYGYPSGRQPTTIILVAPFACDALAAWQAIGEQHVQAHTVLVSTAGGISYAGLERLTKLVRVVLGAQRVRGHADLVTLVDLNGVDENEIVGQSDALLLLAQTQDIKYIRSAPPRGTTWNQYLRLVAIDDETPAGSEDSVVGGPEESTTFSEVNQAKVDDAHADTGGNAQASEEVSGLKQDGTGQSRLWRSRR